MFEERAAIMQFPHIKKDGRITILTLSWRDIRAPKAGGAELFTHKMLSKNTGRYRIIHFSPTFTGAFRTEIIDGVEYFRKGSIFTVIWHAYLYYRKNRDNIDFVIDQCNTHRFFTKFWVKKEKRIFLIYQLTREIWDYHLGFPLNVIGKLFESAMLRLNKSDKTITISESTKQDLLNVGFKPENIEIIPVGLEALPMEYKDWTEKASPPVFIYLGRFAKYKGIDVSIEALSIARKKNPDVRLWILGKKDNNYTKNVLDPICRKNELSFGEDDEDDVCYKGFVSERTKLELLSRANALLFPSIREGWGIIVTEAAVRGTPSIVYDSPGCRDAVDFGRCGYLCKENTPEELARLMVASVEEKDLYENIRIDAYKFAKNLTWVKTAEKFDQFIMELILKCQREQSQ